jgi:threonine synthase
MAPLAAAGVGRYARWLPVRSAVSLGEPMTPIVRGDWAGVDTVWKVEGGLPSGSFKDRGSAVLVGWLAERGVDRVVDDSSGNAGASLAAYCARAGIACQVHVPSTASPAKLRQLEAYGADVVLVPGPRSAATDSAQEAAAGGRGVYASHLWSPLFLAGTATFAWEAWEQLGRAVPDVVIVPLGGGSLLLGAARGFAALRDAGLASRTPRLYGIQSTACEPMTAAFRKGEPEPANVTVAAGLAEGALVARPPRGAAVLSAVRESGGTIASVDDVALVAARDALARSGLYVEPTSALAPAGLERLVAAGLIHSGDVVLAALTGSGLKTPLPSPTDR